MFKKVALIGIVAIGVLAYFNRDKIKRLFLEDTRTVNSAEVKLLFDHDPSFAELKEALIINNVVKKVDFVTDFVSENNIDTNNFAGGKYVILSQTQLADLVNGFVKNEDGNGNAEQKVNVIFNLCNDIYDIGSNISKCIVADSASIVEYIYEEATLKKYGFTKEQIPAMFFPGDYKMYYDTDAKKFVEEMAAIFRDFWTEERKSKMSTLELNSPSKAYTLASIVYAEQRKLAEEWPIIAKLYLNRLKAGILLQSDPTFVHCWGKELDGVTRLLNKHREIDCPYNTYKYAGLPPGPIRITPAEVVDAVLNPADVNYIYMCAKPDYSGEHNFTSELSIHNRNASKYQSWLSKEKANGNIR